MRGGGKTIHPWVTGASFGGEVMNPGDIYVQTKYQYRNEGLAPFSECIFSYDIRINCKLYNKY